MVSLTRNNLAASCKVSDGTDTVCRAVCKNDDACAGFRPRRRPNDGSDGEQDENDMVCYKGGIAVEENFQMCDVTSESVHCPVKRMTLGNIGNLCC